MDCVVANKPKVRAQEIKKVSGKQIGIMGGTFNPVHIAHLVAAEQVMTKLHLDEVWFIPDNIPPHKELALNIPAEDRANMLELATKNSFSWAWLGVWEHNTKAQAFYNRYGFEKFSQHHFMVGQKVDTDWLLRKKLR